MCGRVNLLTVFNHSIQLTSSLVALCIIRRGLVMSGRFLFTFVQNHLTM